MDDFTKKVFDRLANKPLEALNEKEMAFIKARRDYLNDKQKTKFAKILEEKKPAKKAK